MPTALVTGCVGFVGQRMIPALRSRGYTVHGIDIKTGDDARDFFRQSSNRYDLIVHLAAVVGGRAMIEGNPLAVAVDLAIDAELWQFAVRTKQPHVLYFSSSAAYPVALQTGRDPRFPTHPLPRELRENHINLDDLASPDLSYGLAKLVGEYQAREVRKHGVKVTVARPFSGTGPTQTLDYPVPSIVDRAVRREDPLVVWSDSVRDIIHIDDVIDISLAAVDAGIEEPFNCGTGIGTNFTALAKFAADAVGYSPDIQVLDNKPAGVAYRVADPTFMRSFYGLPLRPVGYVIGEMVHARREFLESRVYPSPTLSTSR